MGWTRRETLAAVAGVSGSWLVGCAREDAPGPSEDVVPASCASDAIADSLMAERVDALPVLKKWLVAGASTDTLYAAALTVGARTVVAEELHSALAVQAAYLVSKRVSKELALVPLAYAWNMQHGAVMDFVGRDPLPPLAKVPSADTAEAKLIASFDSFDEAGADAAIAALYAHGGRKAVIGPLTRYAPRDHDWLGHTAIWTAHAVRAMDTFGWACAPWVVRSLARAIAAKRKGSSIGAFAANLMRVGEVPSTFRDGKDDPSAVPALLEVFRTGDAKQCVDATIAALVAGKSRRTVWTALAIVAVEVSVRWGETSFGVHELDALNALRHLQGLAPDRDTEALVLLQAAAWRPEFQAFVASKTAKFPERLEALVATPGAAPTLSAVFGSFSGNRIESARLLAAFLAGGGTVQQVTDAYPTILVEHATGDVHNYKFHAALLEELEAALPEWRKTLILGVTLRGPGPTDPKWARYDEARAL